MKDDRWIFGRQPRAVGGQPVVVIVVDLFFVSFSTSFLLPDNDGSDLFTYTDLVDRTPPARSSSWSAVCPSFAFLPPLNGMRIKTLG